MLELSFCIWIICMGFLLLWLITSPVELFRALKLQGLLFSEDYIMATVIWCYVFVTIFGSFYFTPIILRSF